VFYGSANPGPWNPDMRQGDNKWTSTLFARKPETGEAVWAYQLTQHDLHDYDGVNEQILADIPIGGQTRKVLIRPERNGYVYVIDRTNGQVLSAQPYGFVNATTGVDLQSGALQYNPDKAPQVGKVVREICPAAPGMKDWQPAAYSPRTGLVYIPHRGKPLGELHRGNAVRGHERQDVPGARRESRRVRGVESADGQTGLGGQGGSAGVERRDGHRR